MASATLTLISSYTAPSGGAQPITFSSIPQTYTDLKLIGCARGTGNDTSFDITVNGTTYGYKSLSLYTYVSAPGTGSYYDGNRQYAQVDGVPVSTYTANVFGNEEVYFPNYTNNLTKAIISNAVSENNGTQNPMYFVNTITPITAAITSIAITNAGYNFAQYSTFYLYGIKNS